MTATLAEPRDRSELLSPGGGAGAAVDVRRALHGGWHVDRGMGQPEELSAEGRAADRRRPELPRPAAAQRHAPVEGRSGREAVALHASGRSTTPAALANA